MGQPELTNDISVLIEKHGYKMEPISYPAGPIDNEVFKAGKAGMKWRCRFVDLHCNQDSTFDLRKSDETTVFHPFFIKANKGHVMTPDKCFIEWPDGEPIVINATGGGDNVGALLIKQVPV